MKSQTRDQEKQRFSQEKNICCTYKDTIITYNNFAKMSVSYSSLH